MIRVRFSDGTVLQYNQAARFVTGEYAWTLLDSNNQFVAAISMQSSCVLESSSPSGIYNSLHNVEQLRNLKDRLRQITNYHELSVVVALKRELTHFNARARTWK